MHTVNLRTTTLKREIKRTNQPNSGDKMGYLKSKKEKNTTQLIQRMAENEGRKKQRINGTNRKQILRWYI